jgi:hypothetical protein
MPGPLPGPLTQDPHIPVLIEAILRNSAPVTGVWLDGTLGAGGYARALLAAGAERVIGVDRDPLALAMAESWAVGYGAGWRREPFQTWKRWRASLWTGWCWILASRPCSSIRPNAGFPS